METFCAFKLTNYAKAEENIQNMLQSIIKNVAEGSKDQSFSKSMNRSQNVSLADISQKEFSFRAFSVKVYTLAANLIITL